MDFVILFNIEGSPIQCGAYFIFLPPRKMTNWVWALPLLLMSVMNRAINLSVLSWPEIFLRKYFNICWQEEFSQLSAISFRPDLMLSRYNHMKAGKNKLKVLKQSIDIDIYLHIRLVLGGRKPYVKYVRSFKRGVEWN